MPNGRAGWVAPVLLLGNGALLGFLVFQVHGVEQRLVVQGQQIRALGEATERAGSRGARVSETSQSASAPAGEEQPAHVLHPEVPNFLKPRDRRFPAPGVPLGGTLTRGWPTGDPKGFNPLLENGAEIGQLLEPYITLSLAAQNNWANPNEYHGELASRVEITDDFKEFTIYLRHGVTWATPNNVDLENPRYAWLKGDHEVTAKDIVFTFDMMVNPQVDNAFLKNYYAELGKVEALDDYTVVVHWKKKQFLNVAQTLGLVPIPRFVFAYDEDGHEIPKATLGTRFNQHWYNNKGYIGSGPYRLASYEPGTRIRLTQRDDFIGDRPAIKELVYPIYTDANQTLLKLKAHEIGVGLLMPNQYREEIKQYEDSGKKPAGSPFFDGRLECKKIPAFSYSYLAWNADKPIFADKRVRRAMTMALNRKDLIEKVFGGLGKVTTGPYLSTTPYNDPSVKPIPFDLAGAKALLAEAGWTDTDGDGLIDKALHPGEKRTPFAFTFLFTSSSKEWATMANVFKEDLLKIGVKLNTDAVEWSLMQKRAEEHSFDVYAAAWLLPWDEDLYQIWHSSQADAPKGSNRIGFRNKEADQIIEAVRVTFDPDERTKLFRRFHVLVNEEQPYTFFREGENMFCNWKDVKNVEFAMVRPADNSLPWGVARAAP